MNTNPASIKFLCGYNQNIQNRINYLKEMALKPESSGVSVIDRPDMQYWQNDYSTIVIMLNLDILKDEKRLLYITTLLAQLKADEFDCDTQHEGRALYRLWWD